MEERGGGGIQSVQRSFLLLELLAKKGGEGASIHQLAEATGLAKSTVHRILANLVQLGYVAQVHSSGHYRATMKLFEVGSELVGKLDMITLARPHLDRLAAEVGETVHMVVRDGAHVVYVYKAEAATGLGMGSRIGLRMPMYCTGVGKALLARLPRDEVHRIWDESDIRPLTPNTIRHFAQLEEQLADVRRRGWALDDEENETGIRCMAVALPPVAGVYTAFSVSTTAARMPEKRIQELATRCLAVAGQIMP